jgi:maltose O-acetyltransferase
MRIRLLLLLASVVNPASQDWYRRIVRRVLTRFGVNVRGLPLWISSTAFFDYRGGITVGDRCVISNGVCLLTHDYSMDGVAERRFGRNEENLVRSAPIEVGDLAFIGMNSMILPGVTIGPGAVVGAGSVVTRDVPADTVVAGNPATVVSDTEAYWVRSQSKFQWAPRRR